jgi:hypothetical protein
VGNTQGKRKGGARKIGRSLAKCKAYRDAGTREKNKARKARKEAKKALKRANRPD